MNQILKVGLRATVQVPATSANLGPGFDSLGLALNWTDEATLEVIPNGFEFELSGEGADEVPRDESHLVIATALEALSSLNVSVPGLRLSAHNTIPHGSGLGSSSAALVAGLLLAWGLARPGEEPDRDWLLREAYVREGHADNIAPAIFGGFVITWSDFEAAASDLGVRVCTSTVHPDIVAIAFVPQFQLPTTKARGVLPAKIDFQDAAANTARSALLVHAMAAKPELLYPATADWLHQDYRRELLPTSHALMSALRKEGFAAFISGAGPTVLVLTTPWKVQEIVKAVSTWSFGEEFRIHHLAPGNGAKLL